MTSEPTVPSLLGTWRLERFRVWNPDRSVSEPKGKQPFGYARFDPSGVAIIFLATQDPSLTPQDLAASFVAYSGPFHAEPHRGRLSVSVIASNRADYLDTVQVREYTIYGDSLTLGTPGQYEATCRRVAPT